MAGAVQRIVAQSTLQDKKAIAAKAKKLAIPTSERMRRGAVADASSQSDCELVALASVIKSKERLIRQAEAMKGQQSKIDDPAGGVNRLEAQREPLSAAAFVSKRKGNRRIVPWSGGFAVQRSPSSTLGPEHNPLKIKQ